MTWEKVLTLGRGAPAPARLDPPAPRTKLPPSVPSVVGAAGPARARSGLVGAIAAAGIVALKLLKGAKAAKFLLFGATLWSIALVRPLPFAAALIYAIFVHETGHLLAMKRRGLKTSGIWLLPFLGAVAVAKQPFRSHGETYFVAIARPVFGLSPSFRCSRRRGSCGGTTPTPRRGSAMPRPRRSSTSSTCCRSGSSMAAGSSRASRLSLSPRLGIVVVPPVVSSCARPFSPRSAAAPRRAPPAVDLRASQIA